MNAVLKQLITVLGLAIVTGLLVILTNIQSSAVLPALKNTLTKTAQYSSNLKSPLPLPPSPTPPLPHPLPPTLTQWQDPGNSGDYFSQVTPSQFGYLVWSQFPIQVYVETPKGVSGKQAEAWVNAISQAVHEWNAYLPLAIVERPEVADITIVRKTPPLQISAYNKIPRARSAQTTYEVYTKNNVLLHRFTILLSPSQTGEHLIASARHELGHALGIWGHSPLQSDALYFSQVRNPPPISSRDVNTLKRVYEQPTSLGWFVARQS
ncbi:MAG: peptidase [Stigonema ocellatum SAG 48.90 = DSM 106950]|nr:peptidase [Stigonema ocellatum SAG 48.90 = DSM 106950]